MVERVFIECVFLFYEERDFTHTIAHFSSLFWPFTRFIWTELLLIIAVFSIKRDHSSRTPPFSFDPRTLPHHFIKLLNKDLSEILTISLFTIHSHDGFLKRRGRIFQFKKSKVTYQNLHSGWKGYVV